MKPSHFTRESVPVSKPSGMSVIRSQFIAGFRTGWRLFWSWLP